MKKLALALMCLVSVAFFASCQKPVENPEPSIAVMTGENFITGTAENPTIIDITDANAINLKYGFHVEANAQTKKELSTLKLTYTMIDAEGTETFDTIIDLSGKTSYDFSEFLFQDEDERDIYFEATINALVTDADSKTNTATIAFKLDLPAQPLFAKTFEWYRLGNTQTGLAEFGLKWERNIKETHAQIKPLEGVTLYTFDSSVWDETTTDVAKAALFSDGATTIEVYNNVSTSVENTYDDVIGTKMADGTLHLIHVTKCVIDDYQSAGYPIHITGEAK